MASCFGIDLGRFAGYTVRWRHAEGSTVNENDRSHDLTELSQRKRRLGG